MGKSKATPGTWDQNVNVALRETFGITATGGVYLTGVDILTLPMAFAAGAVIGAGIGVWRNDDNIARPARGMGAVLCGLTVVVPPYVRIAYAPWLFISPLGCAWAAFTGGIVGAGMYTLRDPRRADAVVVDADSEIRRSANAFVGAALIGAGLYLAAPGALRVAMMYGGS